jgi:hypothetical protein
MWDPGTLVVYSWGPVEGETKNPIDMWIDDCVSLVTIEAIALREILEEQKEQEKETPSC